MAVQKVQVTVLIENTPNPTKPELEAKHGLSVYVKSTIDDKKVTVLMDMGSSPEKLLHNIIQLNINPDDIDAIVLSHGHYDHTGGLIELLKQRKKQVPVIGHPTVFSPKISMMPHMRLVSAPFKMSEVENFGGVPLLASNPVKIAPGITTTGEVPRTTNFEKVNGFWAIHQQKFVDDIILDDQSLVIEVENKGLIVIAGCAHAGIINTLKYAQEITGNNKIFAVMGGFHLMGEGDEKINMTIMELKKFAPTFVGPCHCTGKNVITKFAEGFKDKFIEIHTGTVVEF